VSNAVKAKDCDTAGPKGAPRSIAGGDVGRRNIVFEGREIRDRRDIKRDSKGGRVAGDPDREDTMFRPYGRGGRPNRDMPSASVYQHRCRPAVGRRGKNGVKRLSFANKHYEVHRVLSMTEHEATTASSWVSDTKLWNSLTPEQSRVWGAGAGGRRVNKTQPAPS